MELDALRDGISARATADQSKTITAQNLTCTICTATGFNNVSKLNKHKQSHTKPYECLAVGCTERFAQQQALTRHVEVRHVDENAVTKFYHCTVDGCKYSSKGRRSRRFARPDQAKEHIKDYGHYGPHSSNERARRAGNSGKHLYLEFVIEVFYEEWTLNQWELRSCKYNSLKTRLWFLDDVGELYIRKGPGAGLQCPTTHCYYSSCPPRNLPPTEFKSSKGLQEHIRRSHPVLPEPSMSGPASLEKHDSERDSATSSEAAPSNLEIPRVFPVPNSEFPNRFLERQSPSIDLDILLSEADQPIDWEIMLAECGTNINIEEDWTNSNYSDFGIDNALADQFQPSTASFTSQKSNSDASNNKKVTFPHSPSMTSMHRHPSSSRIRCPFPDCDTTCRRKSDMQRHLRNRHYPSGFFNCKLCSRKYGRKDKLTEHLRLAHPGASYSSNFAKSNSMEEQSMLTSIFTSSSILADAGSIVPGNDLRLSEGL